MKKILLSLAALCGLGFAASAQDVVVDFSAAKDLLPTKESATPQDVVVDGITFSMMNCKGGTYSQASYLQISGKSVDPKGYIEFSLDFDCSAITLHTGSNASTNVKLVFSADGTDVETRQLNDKDADFVYNISAEHQASGTVYKLQVAADNKYNAQVTTLTFTKAGGVVKKAAGLSFAQEAFTITYGDEFTAPVLTKDTNADVTYASDNDDVASVDETTGAVRIEGIGTVKITATAAENDEYYGGSASYTIDVQDPSTILSATFNDSNEGFTFEDGTLPEGLTFVWTRDASYGYMKASAYKSSTNYAVDGAYLVSPELDLTGRKNATLAFRQVVNFFSDIETSKTECSVCVREVGGEWGEALEVTGWPEALGWNPWVDSSVSLDAYVGKKIQVGFKYTSTDAKAGTWEVDNVVVSGEQGTSAIATVETEDADAPVELFNLQGVRVANPENGLYIRRQGNKVEKVVIR